VLMGKVKLVVVGVGKRIKCVTRRRIMVGVFYVRAGRALSCSVGEYQFRRRTRTCERNGLKFWQFCFDGVC
jgi:hypothetical protein